MIPPPPRSTRTDTLFPYTTLFRSRVDVPVHGNRDHDKLNGFKMPLRYTPRLIADLALHPCWCWQILRHSSPQLKNLARSSRMPENIAEQAAALSRQMEDRKSTRLNSSH